MGTTMDRTARSKPDVPIRRALRRMAEATSHEPKLLGERLFTGACRDLPEIAVGIGEVAEVPAPQSAFRRLCDRAPGAILRGSATYHPMTGGARAATCDGRTVS